jgi:hypothetical protein
MFGAGHWLFPINLVNRRSNMPSIASYGIIRSVSKRTKIKEKYVHARHANVVRLVHYDYIPGTQRMLPFTTPQLYHQQTRTN